MAIVSQQSAAHIRLKSVTEFPLPAGTQTHEIVSPLPGLLAISQQPDSALVKMRVDVSTGRPISAVKHTIDSAFSGLHGLHISKRYPGCVWATLQFTSELLLIDPQSTDPEVPPTILKRIALPAPAKGPHVVIENGADLWASCKDSHHVVRINADDPSDAAVYPCAPRPIFVAVHPQSGDVYASLDQSSAIFRIVNSGDAKGTTQTIAIPTDMGSTPVGLIPGPDGNVWFVLLGNSSGGQGRFGRITAAGAIEWFQLNSGAAMGAGLIHLSFAPGAGETGAPERLFLLGSSMASMMALNAVFDISLSGGYSKIESQQTIAFPSQNSMSHRVLSTTHGLYVTELGACAVAHLQPAFSPYGEGINEMSDAYALWGCGVPGARADY